MKPDRAYASSAVFSWLPWLSLLIGLGTTYAVWHDSRDHAWQARQERFDFYVAEIVSDIENRMHAYEQVLHSTAALFAASESVGRDEFKTYVESLQLAENYPGIQGIGFSLRVPAKDKHRHIESIRRQGFADYRLHPEAEREHYTSIIYIEPFDWRNQRAFGYDMYAEPVRREAMRLAGESGLTTVSGRVTLLQETDTNVQPGFLMYEPVYRYRSAHDTPAQRQANLYGWAYAPFRVTDLMQGVLRRHFGEKQAVLDLEIYDGVDPAPEHLLYDSDQVSRHSNAVPSRYLATRHIEVNGRTWTLLIGSLQAFEAPARLTAIAVIGSIGSLLLAMLLWQLINGRREAVRLAEKMNHELCESTRYQQELLINLPVAVVVHGADSAIRYANDEAGRLLGQGASELRGSVADAFTWHFLRDDGAPMAPADYPVNRVLASKAPLHGYELGIVRNDMAEPLWVQVNAFPYLDDAGRFGEVVVTFLDITARRAAKDALHQALVELDDLYHCAPCGYHSLDETGRIMRINKTELDWLGYRREELVGKRFVELITPDSIKVFEDNYPRFKASGAVHDLEYELIRKDGSTFTVLLSATAAYDSAGRFVMSRSTMYDITARKRAERELQHRNHLYALLNRANQAIVRLSDLDHLLEEICHVAVEEGGFVMAWAGRVVEGRVIPYAHWGHENGYLEQARIIVADRALGAGPTGTAIREGRHYICDDIATDPHMEPWRALALERGYRASAAFPVRVAGAVVGAINLYAPAPGYFSAAVVTLLDDLTEDVSFAMNAHDEAARRKQAEEDLRQLNEQLEHRVAQRTRELETANKELESFSYSVSHDLRAPLRGIDGFSQVLLKRYADKLDDTGRDYLQRVRRASQRMGELIDDLLNLSRMTRSPLRRQEVDLSSMAEALLQEMQRAAPERQVRITVQPGMHVFGDPGLLRVVLDNLLGNAWKFTRHTEQAAIEFSCETRNGELLYSIRDNGAGFDNTYAHKLFQVFQRLHGNDEFEGTGIGLATVSRIIQRHHGSVCAQGEPGRGATFSFTLPQRNDVREDETNIAEQEQTP